MMSGSVVHTTAQMEYATWVFGSGAHISFLARERPVYIERPRELNYIPTMEASEGVAVYSHPCTGQLMMYSDGRNIFNETGFVIDGGSNLIGGESSTQGGLFITDPADPDIVWLVVAPDLTGEQNAGRPHAYGGYKILIERPGQYRVIEREIPMTSPDRPYLMQADSGTEKLTATHLENQLDVWVAMLVTQGATSRIIFRLLTKDGFAPSTVEYELGWRVGPAGAMKFSPNGRHLAFVEGDQRFIHLFDFDKRTARLSNARSARIPLQSQWNGTLSRAYGLSFSPQSRNVFVSARGTLSFQSSVVVGFDVSATTSAALEASGNVAGGASVKSSWSGALQLAPNGWIYMCAGEYVSRISNADNPPHEVKLDMVEFRLDAPASGRIGLPSAVESTYMPGYLAPRCRLPVVTMDVPAICEGTCSPINATVTPDAKRVVWYFPGSTTDSVVSVTPPDRVCYPKAGTYVANVVATSDNGTSQFQYTLTVNSLPNVDAGEDKSACLGGSIQLRARGAKTYRWSPGTLLSDSTIDTPLLRNLDGPRTYVVTGIDTNGCINTDTIMVSIGPFTGTGQGDTTVCPKTEVQISATGGSGCRWLDNPSITSNQRTVIAEGTRTYRAELSDGACVDTVSVTVRAHAGPGLLRRNDTVICRGDVVDITPVTELPVTVRYERGGPKAAPIQKTQYIVHVTTSQGCTESDTIEIDVEVVTLEAMSDTTICAGDRLVLSAVSSHSVRWTDTSGLPISTAEFRPTKDTTVICTTNTSCVKRDTVEISVIDPTQPRRIDTSTCAGVPLSLVVPSRHGIRWTANNSLAFNADTVTVTPTAPTTYHGREGLETGCYKDVFIAISIEPLRTVHVSIPDLNVESGEPVDVPMFVRATQDTARVRVRLTASSRDFVFGSPSYGDTLISVTPEEDTIYFPAEFFLGTDTIVDVTIAASTDNLCYIIQPDHGRILREGCATELRPVKLGIPLQVELRDRGERIELGITGGMSETIIQCFDLLGRLLVERRLPARAREHVELSGLARQTIILVRNGAESEQILHQQRE